VSTPLAVDPECPLHGERPTITELVEVVPRRQAPLGVPEIHPQQVAGEQGRLLAALAGLDLEDHVLAVARVAGGEHGSQLPFEFGTVAGELVCLMSEREVFGGQLPGRLLVRDGLLPFLVGVHDRADLAVPPAYRPRALGVSVDRRVSELTLQLSMLAGEVGKLLEHRSPPAMSLRQQCRLPPLWGR